MEGVRFENTLRNVLEQRSLKFVFVGGKGGVGKTTVSSALSVALARERRNVLLISTDPASSIGDAFGQKFSSKPTLVAGCSNLFAMEIDPNAEEEEDEDVLGGGAGSAEERKMFSGLATAMPGVDEAMAFSNVMKLVQSMEFEVVVFDTAPTGHTLRFLQFPQLLSGTFGKLFGLGGGGPMAGLMSQVMSMMGGSSEEQATKLSETQSVIEKVNRQFQDPQLTTFVAVTLPEFLPLYETERLLQDLTKFRIDARNIVVNQILEPGAAQSCAHCRTKSGVQQMYLRQMDELYQGLYHMTYLPSETAEIRGLGALVAFGAKLFQDNEKALKEGS
jgi:arsenite-transporting ATPase